MTHINWWSYLHEYTNTRLNDEEKRKYFRDFILWQQEGLDMEKQHCLFINFGVKMKFEYPQIRSAIVIFLFIF